MSNYKILANANDNRAESALKGYIDAETGELVIKTNGDDTWESNIGEMAEILEEFGLTLKEARALAK